jgi:hypothetical protein
MFARMGTLILIHGLTCKYYAILTILAADKHSNLRLLAYSLLIIRTLIKTTT